MFYLMQLNKIEFRSVVSLYNIWAEATLFSSNLKVLYVSLLFGGKSDVVMGTYGGRGSLSA